MTMRTVVALLSALALAACVTVSKTVLNRSHMAQRVAQEDVVVFFASDSLPVHERIAILNAKGDESFTNETQLIDKMREAAGKLGANAIVLNEFKDATVVEKVAAALFGTQANRRGTALAIFAPSLAVRK